MFYFIAELIHLVVPSTDLQTMSDSDECLRISRPRLRQCGRKVGSGRSTTRPRHRSRGREGSLTTSEPMCREEDMQLSLTNIKKGAKGITSLREKSTDSDGRSKSRPVVKEVEPMEVVRPGRIRKRNLHPSSIIGTPFKNDVTSLALHSMIGGTEEPLAASEYVIKNDKRNYSTENSFIDEDCVNIPTTNFTIGDIVDVTVSLAISPSYFIIQPNNTAVQLDQLSIDMFDFYEELGGGKQVEEKRVVQGLVVAVRHDEGDWYRARVSEILTPSLVMVRLLDFGDLEIAEVEDLRMLEEEFTELPAQGVNARLEGIMPRRGDWGREEEDWWGRRVEGRMFVVQIGESWEAGVNVGVEVVMYDTSLEEDIVLQEEMVQKDLAMYI